jgi:hypothetical protein
MQQLQAPLDGRALLLPALGLLAVLVAVVYATLFDQGALLAPVTTALADSGGVLHELFHDARHLLGVPCH